MPDTERNRAERVLQDCEECCRYAVDNVGLVLPETEHLSDRQVEELLMCLENTHKSHLVAGTGRTDAEEG